MSHTMHGRVIVCFVLMFAVALNTIGPPATSAAQSASALPVLNNAVAGLVAPGMIEVTGERFSPGGLVYIALYDGWGTTLKETRWITSSPNVYGINGSQDPAQGFVAGGGIAETFEQVRQTVYGANGSQDPAQGYVAGDTPAAGSACDGPLMVRAYDQRTASWSNTLDVDLGC